MKLALRDEVQTALEAGEPVLALEATVIAHGLPYPDNLATAREIEVIARGGGVTPATIGVLGGIPVVGLDDNALERFAQSEDVRKLSRRDLGAALGKRLDGATTVAATMALAA